jgi:hypothetical protein
MHFVCRDKQQETRHRKGKESLTFLVLQMMTRTQILLDRESVVKYLVRAMHHYNNKEVIIISYNTGNNWLLLSISTTYKHA